MTRFFLLVYSKNVEGGFCKVCVLFSDECAGKGSYQKVNALVNKPFIKWKNIFNSPSPRKTILNTCLK